MKRMIISTIFMPVMFSMTSFCMEDHHQEQMVDFVYERDVKDVLKIIQDDWNWLFNSTRPNYDPEYVLESEIPNEKEKLKMKVLRKEECAVGLVSFYKKDSSVGRIRLISIAQDSRGKGYDKKLTIAAIKALFDVGCTSALLWTIKENEKVPMYESLGFQEIGLSENDTAWFKEKEIPADEYIKYTKYTVTKETFKF